MIEKYTSLLFSLLPRGIAWARERGSNISKLLEGMAVEFSRIETESTRLVDECYPNTTGEMLPDWERIAGLPECCLKYVDQTESQRRSNLIAKLAMTGGASPSYIEGVAARQGFDITINESPAYIPSYYINGYLVSAGDWVYVFEVNSASTPVFYFEAGTSSAYDRLTDFGVEALECYINQIKPAHTHALFTYDEAYVSGFSSGFSPGFGGA